MKVKVFKFRVSNWTTGALYDDKYEKAYERDLKEVSSEWEIQDEINEFIRDRKVIDIKVNDVHVKYHNNSRGNTVDLIYTILYE